MKTKILSMGIMALIAGIIMTSCEKSGMNTDESSILPERFKIDIPQSLSDNSEVINNLKSTKAADSLSGNQMYRHLRTFIAVGEKSADILETLLRSIRIHKIEQVIELTYVSEDDDQLKHLVVEKNVEFEGRRWEYFMTISDVDSEPNEDGGVGLQLFWSKNPIEGIAIIKPFNLDQSERTMFSHAMYRIEYSEKRRGDYESYMIVSIADLPVGFPRFDRFAMDGLKMFVGKNGDIIDVFGNSNHPNASFFSNRCGFNWAFVASGSQSQDIAVAEVGLPPSLLNATGSEILLKEYSIKNVLTQEINDWFLETFGFKPDSADLAAYLGNADAPGYFANNGFIQGGVAPGDEYAIYEERIANLSPYSPKAISTMEIFFNLHKTE